MKKRLSTAARFVPPILAVALAIFAIASAGAGAPADPSTVRPAIPGKFIWFDLITNNPAAAEKFYGGLLGWTFEARKRNDLPYKIIKKDGALVGGMIDTSSRKADAPESTWLSYISVANVDAVTSAIKAKGGKVLRDPVDLGNVARASAVTDPQGALLGLVHSAKGDPPDTKDFPEGRFFWMEYIARDAEHAMQFYRDVFGYTSRRADGGAAKLDYFALDSAGGIPRAGIYNSPWKEVRPNWLPYVRVASTAAAAAKAKELGGRVVFEPKPEVRNGTLAIVVDPTGAAVALQEWPFEKQGN